MKKLFRQIYGATGVIAFFWLLSLEINAFWPNYICWVFMLIYAWARED